MVVPSTVTNDGSANVSHDAIWGLHKQRYGRWVHRGSRGRSDRHGYLHQIVFDVLIHRSFVVVRKTAESPAVNL